MGWREQLTGWRPSGWAGWRPNGVGLQKPHHYRDMAKVAWANRAHPKYAVDVLRKGACDGCALGVAGLHDWTIDGVHLCTTRLQLLELNTADALDPVVLADVAPLMARSSSQLRRLGRLAHPMRRRRGDAASTGSRGTRPSTRSPARCGPPRPSASALYLTSRGITNETYYVAGKAARAMGIASVDSAARVCHAPSTVGLKETIGVAASTCSLQDVIESDLVVLWGTNPANNQPVFMKYLVPGQAARVPGRGREPVPRAGPRAVLGAVQPRVGAVRHEDLRPARAGAARRRRRLRQRRAQAAGRSAARSTRPSSPPTPSGWDELVAALDRQSDAELLEAAGITADQLDAFVDLYAGAASAVLVWSMGITQHRDAVDGVRAIVNLGLARGNVGRDGAGLMPIRGHSGVQGGAEMGAYATAFPGAPRSTRSTPRPSRPTWGFPVPDRPGLTAPEMVGAAAAGELDVLWTSGGNFLEVLPDPPSVAAALDRVPLRVHQDVVVTTQMLAEGDDVILLPVATRYEQEGGGTSTTTERRIVFSPEIPRRSGRRAASGGSSPTWRRGCGPSTPTRSAGPTNRDLREEIARVVPAYAGIEALATTGDQVQWGGRHLCAAGEFPLPDGRGRFTVLGTALASSCPMARSRSRPAAASSSTRWCTPRSTR